MLLLLATRTDADGRVEPDLAIELDTDGRIVASQYLELAHRDDPETEFADLGDE